MLNIETYVKNNSEKLFTANWTKQKLSLVYAINSVSVTQNIIGHRKLHNRLSSVRNHNSAKRCAFIFQPHGTVKVRDPYMILKNFHI